MAETSHLNMRFNIIRDDIVILEGTTLAAEIEKIQTGAGFFAPLHALILMLTKQLGEEQTTIDPLILHGIRTSIYDEVEQAYGDGLRSDLDECRGYFDFVDQIEGIGRTAEIEGQIGFLEEFTGTTALSPATLGQEGFEQELLGRLNGQSGSDINDGQDDPFDLDQFLE
jgi:hypothetical protein